MKYIQILIVTLCVLVNLSLPAFARQITLQWEPSPTPGVVGYKVYYQQGTPQLPLTGTEANQGSSPIDVGNSLKMTLSGLEDTVVYYFSVTAYDDKYNESTFSNIVSTAWMPPLRNPQKESIVIPWSVTFEWDAGPVEHSLSYTLYYGTDKNHVINAGVIPPSSYGTFPKISLPIPSQGFLTALILLLLLTALTTTRKKARYIRISAVAGLMIFTLVACGDGSVSGWSSEGLYSSSTALTRVDTGSSTSHETNDLESGTTYYWKVDAHSSTEPGTVFHSEVSSFTTE